MDCLAGGPSQGATMMTATALLAATLSSPPFAPDILSPDFADMLDHVDVTVSDDDAVIFALDADGR